MKSGYDLERFQKAQDSVYGRVCEELRSGRKMGHWMWFVFPQMKGLGSSAMSMHFGIASLEEAQAYLRHEVLGTRLRECVALVNAVEGRTSGEIFGPVDDLKFRSSMTLFARTGDDTGVFAQALQKFYGGESDPMTLRMLGE